jgi:hypothetical protein
VRESTGCFPVAATFAYLFDELGLEYQGMFRRCLVAVHEYHIIVMLLDSLLRSLCARLNITGHQYRRGHQLVSLCRRAYDNIE